MYFTKLEMFEGLSVESAIQALSISLGLDAFRKVTSSVPEPYLDEIFHIPQTQLYCAAALKGGQRMLLSVPWDPKITTPPGLYVLGQAYSQYLARPVLKYIGRSDIDPCGPLILRSLNFLGVLAVLPLILSSGGLQRKHGGGGLQANTLLPLMAFPLLFFFSTLYYTDIWSTLFVLLALAVGLVDPASDSSVFKVLRRSLSAILAVVSCTFRQTNILWAGYIAVTLLEQEHRARISKVYKLLQQRKATKGNKKNDEIHNTPDLFKFLYTVITTPSITLPYFLVALSFAAFLVINKGIALGDKENHEFTLNFAQIFHLALHVLFFAGLPSMLFPYSPTSLKAYFKYCTRSHPFIAISSVTAIGLFVHYMTGDPHPFTLADNRHFTFYIWRRLIQPSRDSLVVALAIAAPLYHTGLWLLWPREEEFQVQEEETSANTKELKEVGTQEPQLVQKPANIYTRIFYFLAVFASLVPSPLLEPRYYILPYVIWRIRHYPTVHTKLLPLVETVWYIFINCLVSFLFFNKPFIWPSEPGNYQRFMW